MLMAFAMSAAELKGTVKETISGKPVPKAKVTVRSESGETQEVVTDAQGMFSVQLPVGSVFVAIIAPGFEFWSADTTFRAANQFIAMKIRLNRLSHIDVDGVTIFPESTDRSKAGTFTSIGRDVLLLENPLGTEAALRQVPGVTAYSDDGFGNSRLSIGIRGLNPRRSARVLFLEDGIPIQPAPYVYPNMYYNPPVERIRRVEVLKGSGGIKYGPLTIGGIVNYITAPPRSNFGGEARVTTGSHGYVSTFAEVGGWGSARWHPQLELVLKRGNGWREHNEFEQANITFKQRWIASDKQVVAVKLNGNYERNNATYTGLTEYSFQNDHAFNPKLHDEFVVRRLSVDVVHNNVIRDNLVTTNKAYFNMFDRDWWREDDVFVRAQTWDSKYQAGDVIDEQDIVPFFQSGDLVRVGNGRTNQGILRSFYVVGYEKSMKWDHELKGARAQLEASARFHFERFQNGRKLGFAPDDRVGAYFNADTSLLGRLETYETTAGSGYVQESLDIGRYTLTGGLRLEVFEQIRINRLDDSKLRDQTSAVILPGLNISRGFRDEKSRWFVGMHRGYTPPSSGAINVIFNQGRDDEGFDLRSEKSWNAEAGIHIVKKWIDVEAAGFLLLIQDYQAAGRGTFLVEPGQVRLSGLELAGALDFGKLLRAWRWPVLSMNYTFLDSRIIRGLLPGSQSAYQRSTPVDLSGNALPYVPRYTTTLRLASRVHHKVQAYLEWQYHHWVYTDFENLTTDHLRTISDLGNKGDAGHIPAYQLWNAGVRFEWSKRLAITANASNLLNIKYIGSRLHSNPGQTLRPKSPGDPNAATISSGILPGAPRLFFITLNYDFTPNQSK